MRTSVCFLSDIISLQRYGPILRQTLFQSSRSLASLSRASSLTNILYKTLRQITSSHKGHGCSALSFLHFNLGCRCRRDLLVPNQVRVCEASCTASLKKADSVGIQISSQIERPRCLNQLPAYSDRQLLVPARRFAEYSMAPIVAFEYWPAYVRLGSVPTRPGLSAGFQISPLFQQQCPSSLPFPFFSGEPNLLPVSNFCRSFW